MCNIKSGMWNRDFMFQQRPANNVLVLHLSEFSKFACFISSGTFLYPVLYRFLTSTLTQLSFAMDFHSYTIK